MIILDTNVISALMRPDVNQRAVDWTDSQAAGDFWITAISLMEIRSGLLFMDPGKRRNILTAGLDHLLSRNFKGRVLAFDAPAAERASEVDLIQTRRGKNIGVGDVQIAGIALAHRATLATRNVKDFKGLDIPLVDPWAD